MNDIREAWADQDGSLYVGDAPVAWIIGDFLDRKRKDRKQLEKDIQEQLEKELAKL